jgi:serine phosphatase RsbU (regulator of sigma subunit)
MSRERMGKEFHEDTARLKRLYSEAITENGQTKPDHRLPAHKKLLMLFSALTQRLNPMRRLLFGLSIVAFIGYFVLAVIGIGGYVPLFGLFLPFAFASMLMLLLIELLEKTDVKHEIDLAREIQLSLLPSTHHKSGDLEICSFANTAKEVGGDYVDLIETPEGIYQIIADVSGKGLKSALYMVRMQALVHLIIEKDRPSPKNLFLELNDYVKSSAKDKTFVTACAAFFPKDKNQMIFARAGHNPPVFYSREHDDIFPLRSNGFALGMTSTPNLEKRLTEKKYHFKAHDSVFFYTDGLTEARNARGEQYGMEQLKAILSVYGSLHAQTIIKKVQNSLENFIGDAALYDDITFTCVHRSSSE